MTTENTPENPTRPILSYIKDLPNICSLAGLGCTLLAIYFLIVGLYPAAMIGMIWAVAFDWASCCVPLMSCFSRCLEAAVHEPSLSARKALISFISVMRE